jgi:hypothetical protein
MALYTTGDHAIVDSLWDIEGVDEVDDISPLSDWEPCASCIHWNGPRWGCELGDNYIYSCLKVPDERPDDIPEWVFDVDGAGTTGFVTNRSNRAY